MITGKLLADEINMKSNPNDILIISDIETLSDKSDGTLGDIWRAINNANGECEDYASNICKFLLSAFQVINFYAHIKNDPGRFISVDDGSLLENKL